MTADSVHGCKHFNYQKPILIDETFSEYHRAKHRRPTIGVFQPRPHQAPHVVELGACALSDLIASQAVSCVEVMTAYLGHIERTNPSYNAIVSLRGHDEILAEAREKDALLARGIRQGWLHGIPQAIKDLASTKGLRTTLGSPLHRDSLPTRDAASFTPRI